jgi:hypothetical protein
MLSSVSSVDDRERGRRTPGPVSLSLGEGVAFWQERRGMAGL